MPPHCDTLDGPVVTAAKKALETGNVSFILPWVPKKAEVELREAFEKTLQARKLGKEAAEVADYWFFETAVRLHREGEGAPYTGLKPEGLDWGPVVPRADRAIEKGDAKEVIDFIVHAVEEELEKRFRHAMEKKNYDVNDVDAAREYVQAMLGFVLYAHHLYEFMKGGEMRGEEGMGGHKH
ncbi:MAG: DUF6448 family protein [Candidatus Bathyarchaeia archaeon]